MNTRNGPVANNIDDKIDSVKDGLKNLVDQGSEKVDALKTRVVEVKDEAMTRGQGLLDDASEVIKAHPLKAVGIAFAIGYIGMRLFR